MFTTHIFYLIVTLYVVSNCINGYLNIIIFFLEKVQKLYVHDSSHCWTVIYIVGFKENFCKPV